MDLRTAKETINRQLPDYLRKAKEKGYVCPVPGCDNGTGKDGDGITSPDGQHYKCFKCGFYGDNLDLIGLTYNLPEFVDRVKKGCEIYGLQLDEYDGRQQQTATETKGETAEAQQPDPEPQEDYTPQLQQWYENMKEPNNPGLSYLQGRGLSIEVIDRFKIGYCPEWRHPKAPTAPATPRVIIPTSKYSYLARDIRNQIPEEQRKYSKSKAGKVHFIGIEAARKSNAPVFLVEGELDAISIYEAGGTAAAIGSTAYIEKFLEALDGDQRRRNGFPHPFVIAMDNDAAGRDAAEKLKKGLQERGAKVFECNPCGNHKDANEALTASRAAFIQNIKGISIDPEMWLKRQENQTITTLQGFINGIAESVNTPAISTGFEQLDRALDRGLYEGLYTLIARTGAGKTTFAHQIADQIAQNGHTVFYYNLEMGTAELMAKSVSRLTFINSMNGQPGKPKTVRGITDGRRYNTEIDAAGNVINWGYSEEDKALINLSLQDYSEYCGHLRFFEKIGYIDTDEIRRDVAFEKQLTGKAPVICIDYLQMLSLGIGLNSATKGMTEYSAINKAVLDLKTISRDFKTPVIAISSMNREGTKSKKSAGLENALGSGSIDYTADVSLILEYADAENGDLDLEEVDTRDTRDMVVKIEKNRNGTRGGKVNFIYTPAYNYFEETTRAGSAAADTGRITF